MCFQGGSRPGKTRFPSCGFDISMTNPSPNETHTQQQKLVQELEHTRRLLQQEREIRTRLEQDNLALSAHLDHLPLFICLIEGDYTITYTNAFCSDFFGEETGARCYTYFLQRQNPCPKCPLRPGFSERSGHILSLKGPKRSARAFKILNTVYTTPAGAPMLLSAGIDVSTEVETITEQKKRLRECRRASEKNRNAVERKTIALKEVLSQLEIEKQKMAEKVEVNVQKVLLPVIDKLIEKSSSLDSRYLMMLKQNLKQLTSSVGKKISDTNYNLTPKEIELCGLIKGGFSIKEIATMQNLSERTVETHRLNIRRKLGLTSAKINLTSYLSQL